MPAPDWTLIDVDAALAADFDTIIDARTAAEFAHDHWPGAINCPVLDDAERVEVGTLDRQVSSFAARRRGAALVSRNIARLLEHDFAERPRDWKPLVYCWRGGQRSGALTEVLSRVGWSVRRLDGGYRAFRRRVLSDLAAVPALQWRVIAGPTGSGKSRLLRALSAAGAQVLDLEALAAHRGSVLGALPGAPQPSQKRFETLVWSRLRQCAPDRPVFVEAESRRVGALRIPDGLLDAIRAAPCLRVELPMSQRVELLRAEYVHLEGAGPLLQGLLAQLTELHGRARIAEWQTLAAAGRFDGLVTALLSEHYDPAYRRSMGRNFERLAQAQPVMINGADDDAFAAAAAALVSAPAPRRP